MMDDMASPKTARETFSSSAMINEQGVDSSKPNADHFPEVTLMFADVVGFSKLLRECLSFSSSCFLDLTICHPLPNTLAAWSSTREPSQVFVLLETIFNEFDQIAARRRVFK
jgi:hypothetical protein